MVAHYLKDFTTSTQPINEKDEFSIPLDINDIIFICKEYSRLGYQIQDQIQNILEFGIEESIGNGFVKTEALPHIRFFLEQIVKNAYFGDAAAQANDCILLIKEYQSQNANKLPICKLN